MKSSSASTPPSRNGNRSASRSAAAFSLALLLPLVLSACGGGSSNPPTQVVNAPVPVAIQPSVTFRGQLLNTTAGANAADWVDGTCTDNRQKNWVRSWLFEDYLFYREAPLTTIDPNTYTGTVQALFGDYTTRGVPAKDRFSFVITQAQADATFSSGVATSVGMTLKRDPSKGNIIRIAYVDPNGPAAFAGFARGMVLTSVDGVPTSNDIPQALFDKLFASPPGTTSAIGVQDAVGGPVRTISVSTASFATTPLITERYLAGNQVGYIAYNSFSTPIGEVQLADAFKRFSAAGVTDMVIDLRYNGGGFLDIAAQLGYMLAGPTRSNGKSFETLTFNDKRTSSNETIPFRNAIAGFPGNESRANEPLASVNVQRVFVLATGSTCSASESVINALQGVDVQVIVIGSTTCGKPYGFSQDNNCTLAYFGIEFEGRNQKGQITPVTGVTPTCAASDDMDHQLGDPAERMLAAALSYRQNNTCPAAGVSALKSALERKPDQPNADMEFASPLDSIKLRRKP